MKTHLCYEEYGIQVIKVDGNYFRLYKGKIYKKDEMIMETRIGNINLVELKTETKLVSPTLKYVVYFSLFSGAVYPELKFIE